MNASQVIPAPAIQQEQTDLTLRNVTYVTIVPEIAPEGSSRAGWRARMAAGGTPHCFFSVEGFASLGGCEVKVQCNSHGALGADGKLINIPGFWVSNQVVACPATQQDGCAATDVDRTWTPGPGQDERSRPVAVRPDGSPAIIEPLAQGWKPIHVLKSSLRGTVPGMTLKLAGASTVKSLKWIEPRGKRAGYWAADIAHHGNLVAVPRTDQATIPGAEAIDEVTYVAAARRDSRVVPAVLA